MRLPGLTTAAALWAFYRVWSDPEGLSQVDLAVIALGYAASGAVGSSGSGGARAGAWLARTRRVWSERLLGRLARAPWATLLMLVPITIVAYRIFGTAPDPVAYIRLADWPVNASFARAAYEAIERGRPLTWATEISAGEPIFDLYPTLVHRTLAHVAFALGDVRWILPLMGLTTMAAFTGVAIGVARAAQRLGAPWPAAAIAGCAVLLDGGSDFSWGMRATFRWGFFPSTCAIAVALLTLPAVLDLAQRRGSLVRVAIGVGLAAAMHPVGVVLAVSLFVGAFFSWLVPNARGPRGAERAMLGLALGLALTAPMWAPASARIVAYGIHYGTPVLQLHDTIDRMRHGRTPDGDFGALMSIGWVICAVSLLDRDPRRRMMAVAAFFLIALLAETLFLDLGLAPSSMSVRWQAYRIGTYVKPLLCVMGAVGIGALAHVRPITSDARVRLALRGACLVLTLWLVREGSSLRPSLLAAAEIPADRRRTLSVLPDPTYEWDLASVAETIVRERDALHAPHARVLLWCPTQCPYTALETFRAAGLSTLITHVAPAGFFLRDQFHTTTPENLRRFGIRWIVGDRPEPPPTPSRTFGDILVHDNPDWDGEIAHVVNGAGVVHSRVVPGEGFDLELDGDAPADVELGTPWYARLRATHDGADVPVEAMLVDGPMHEHAVRLRLSPGLTRVRSDGWVPSDAAGWPFALIALLGLALAAYARRPEGVRVRRAIETWTPAIRRWAPRGAMLGVAIMPALLVLSTGEWSGRARSLRFGPLFPNAQISVEASDGTRTLCREVDDGRRRRCSDGTTVEMSTLHRLSDWHIGWPAPTPAITVRGGHSTRLVIAIPVRLEGDYYGICSGCTADLSGPSGFVQHFDGTTTRVHLAPLTPVSLTMTSDPDGSFSLVDAATLDPPFTYPLAHD